MWVGSAPPGLAQVSPDGVQQPGAAQAARQSPLTPPLGRGDLRGPLCPGTGSCCSPPASLAELLSHKGELPAQLWAASRLHRLEEEGELRDAREKPGEGSVCHW